MISYLLDVVFGMLKCWRNKK